MSEPIIAGIQQVGVGVASAPDAFDWYRRHFGFDVRIFDDVAEAPLMRGYTGGVVQRRRAILAVNMAGGGGLELWQFLSRTPAAPVTPVALGHPGLFAARLKTPDADAAMRFLRDRGAEIASVTMERDPDGVRHFFVRDPFGNHFDVAEHRERFTNTAHPIGGVYGVMIGVSDADRSVAFYRFVLGFDRVIFDATDRFADLAAVPGGIAMVRRVRLGRSTPPVGPFSALLGAAHVELVQTLDRFMPRIYDGRFWGDLGFIHVCFDVSGSDAIHARASAAGRPATVDSAGSFDMGEAAGRFSYVEDPDGTLVELVETHKVPVLKKLGWYIDLRKRPADRALPKWMVRSLAFNRVRD
jgi:catechol 2,3-dioxygenase-like lactoylglutathione lyase family enzyme